MNPEDSHDEIGELLRSQKPQVTAPPRLEARILRSLEVPAKSPAGRFWPWLLLPPAVASVVLMLQPPRKEVSPVTRMEPPPAPEVATPPAPVRWNNPLESESLALQRDVNRAGRFLINCLPSIPAPAE